MNKKPNYWCTWSTQNILSKEIAGDEVSTSAFIGDQGAQLARSMLNEETLFKKQGLVDREKEVSADLYLLLDDGWDVPYGIHPDENEHLFSSLVLDEERFPSFLGTPAQRLKKLNDKVKSLGWRGIGIWVACQNYGEKYKEPVSHEEMLKFWEERFEWCQYAKVEYVKVDWGARCYDSEYRKNMSEIAKRICPNTKVLSLIL